MKRAFKFIVTTSPVNITVANIPRLLEEVTLPAGCAQHDHCLQVNLSDEVARYYDAYYPPEKDVFYLVERGYKPVYVEGGVEFHGPGAILGPVGGPFVSFDAAAKYANRVLAHMDANGGRFPNFCAEEWR